MVFYWKLKHSYNSYMPLHPGPDARIFRMSLLLATYEVRKFPRHFHCCCFENTNGLTSVRIQNEIIGNKTKTFKTHLEISKIYSSFMFVYHL